MRKRCVGWLTRLERCLFVGWGGVGWGLGAGHRPMYRTECRVLCVLVYIKSALESGPRVAPLWLVRGPRWSLAKALGGQIPGRICTFTQEDCNIIRKHSNSQRISTRIWPQCGLCDTPLWLVRGPRCRPLEARSLPGFAFCRWCARRLQQNQKRPVNQHLVWLVRQGPCGL